MTVNTTPESIIKLYGVHNNRELIVKSQKIVTEKGVQKTVYRYDIDEDQLDLFSYYDYNIPSWQPLFKVKPYAELSKIFLDIETAGLDPNKDRIFLLGVINENGETLTIKHEDEAIILDRFFQVLLRKNPDILATFNGFEFDLKFIIRRCQIHGIQHPFYVRTERKTVFRTAQLFGKPVEYNAIYLKNSNCAVIDLYHQVLSWDFVARKLTSHSLKQSALQMGLRQEERLELMYDEMLECWEERDNGRLAQLEEYLEYDLEDTKLLGDRLIPSIYYQKLFLDWSLQSLSTAGNGTKWNCILENALPKVKHVIMSQSPKKFQGGLTGGTAGFYRNVSKVDVNSLYPSVMLTYGIHSNKDSDAVQLQILKYMRDERLRLKELAETDPEADQMQGAMKVMINSCFTGDTLVPTFKGVYPMKELENKEVFVVNGNGDWSKVKFEYHGVQDIWEIVLRRNQKNITIKTTAEHDWYAAPYSRITTGRNKKRVENIKFDKMMTCDLKPGMIIPFMTTPKPEKNQNYYNGVVHGIIYGDGTFHKYKYSKNRFSVALANGKKELEKYFHKADNIRWISTNLLSREDLHCRVSIENLSDFDLKKLPKGTVTHNYILGFIRGLLATDGNVCKRDGLTVISGRKEMCEWIMKWGELVGYQFNSIAEQQTKGKITSFDTYLSVASFNCCHVKFDQQTLDEDDFLRDFHKENFLNVLQNRQYLQHKTWKIISVTKTTEVDHVYCCNEPVTHKFMLHGGILTGNCYGMLGTPGISFNDYEAAALVTAYGRGILKLMRDKIIEFGGFPIELDTDGICYSCQPGKEREIWQKVNESMPRGISIAFEWTAKSFFVPPKTKHSTEGLKKNYIIVFKEDKIKANGKFRKRDKCVLEKTFQPELVKRLTFNGKNSAQYYYDDIVEELMLGEYPLENLIIRRKIRVNEKKLVLLGIGQPEQQTWYYFTLERVGKMGKKYYIPTQTEPYSSDFYIELITDQYEQVMRFA